MLSLQSGSDIRGIATENPEKKLTLTPAIVHQIGLGFAQWLGEQQPEKQHFTVAIGRDSRLSGPMLESTLVNTLVGCGFRVFACGLATTPSLFMSTVYPDYNCDAAIMITASHMPSMYNGLKFFTKTGGLGSAQITRLLTLAQTATSPALVGTVEERPLLADYARDLVEKIRQGIAHPTQFQTPLAGCHIIVDAGNGAGGFFADSVLTPLGADVSGSQFLTPDGRFPNHIPNPEDKEAMASIVGAVLKTKADLGIIFDTDVDRAAVVSHDGAPWNRNALIALISAIVLETAPGGTVVTDSVTSSGLGTFIKARGGHHHRFKRGYRNVINEAIRLNESGVPAPLAIETSGHAALAENYFLDDGTFLVAKILIKMAQLKTQNRMLDELVADLAHPVEEYGRRFPIDRVDFRQWGDVFLANLAKFVVETPGWSITPENYEGLRVDCDPGNGDGWFLLRLSLHEPLLVLDAESDTPGGIQAILLRLTPFLQADPAILR